MGRDAKNWRRLEPGYDAPTTSKAINTHLVSGIFKQQRTFIVVSDVYSQFSNMGMFSPQMKSVISASLEIIFFWAWLIISVCENEPKLKETTVNYFVLRYQRSLEEYTRENGEIVIQEARIVWASLTSSLEVTRYDYLSHRFCLTFQLPLFSVKLKVSNFIFWLEIHGVFLRFFLLFDSVTSATTSYNVGVFKPTDHNLNNSS